MPKGGTVRHSVYPSCSLYLAVWARGCAPSSAPSGGKKGSGLHLILEPFLDIVASPADRPAVVQPDLFGEVSLLDPVVDGRALEPDYVLDLVPSQEPAGLD